VEISGDRNCLFEDCNFKNCFGNTTGTGNHGGAIYAANNGSEYIGTLKLKNCKFDLCSGGEGGAIYLKSYFYLLFNFFYYLEVQSEFDDCLFRNCSSPSWGGAICVEFWGNHNFSRCIFLECKILDVFIYLYIFFFIYYIYILKLGWTDWTGSGIGGGLSIN
jgi:hypothetical protein